MFLCEYKYSIRSQQPVLLLIPNVKCAVWVWVHTAVQQTTEKKEK